MAYFRCGQGGGTSLTIQITTSSAVLYGQTITISKGGSTVGTTTFDNSGEAEYTVDEVGTYTVSVTLVGSTYSETVVVTDTFDTEINPIPDGSTATPTDDIQTWMHCADIWDKEYTAIADVLADTTTFNALVQSDNAVDYMVRSTTWATDVCADSSAMTIIGADNYCSDTLLANETWCTAICDSTYFESVLTTKIPTMTSNTTPSGVASTDSANRPAYYAFNGVGNSWVPSGNGHYVQYEFPNAVVVKKVQIRATETNRPAYLVNLSVSNDGTFTTLYTYSTNAAVGVDVWRTFATNNTAYKYYRLYVNRSNSYDPSIGIFQCYGRASS